jgi:uncharacterized protein YutE (UPF0331/DUF86 family)
MRFVVKIGELENYLQSLDEILPDTEEEYLRDYVKRLATERLLQLSIEVVLDLCAMLVQQLRLGPPSDEENILELLRKRVKNIELIKEMKSFRNILVHRYGEINNRLVFENATQGRDDFEKIIEEFREIIEKSI